MRVAVLLAICAVLGAIIGLRSEAISTDAGSDATAAVRADVKRGAEIVNDSARIYAEDTPLAMAVAEGELRAGFARRFAADSSGETRSLLKAEAAAQAGIAGSIAPTAALVGNPKSAPALSAADVMDRLAQLRAKFPELVDLHPEELASSASDLRKKSALLLAALIPVALGFFAGALAEGFPHLRRQLLWLGSAGAVVGLVGAIAIEVSL